ncbi:TIGR03621 family F420-dependent LLM class oxidoreductase [Nocardia veterana]|uniref:TIGR03621 family F420-dependent LLM class oxidoreductase n=1 Tax=Nocardia veterana TaxID=132249 RepID=A0A7X6M0Y7_9NOCA|nr:TIGR03621 family F420-dependent LLM class oxidoreductase [Nocardia veterana]NKY88243.1 TIGR03621 family F420-dependent LLM class oxidoreductase [Nocardia veterana]
MRDFRFGVNFLSPGSADEWAAKCRRAETLGYDVLLVPDHLEMPAPFPSVLAAAQATERPRVGTFVLNAAFWNPVLLARDVVSTARLSAGRLELGLGTGYVRAEFDEAGIDFGTPRTRVDHLERTLVELDRLLPDPRPTILLGGSGNRMLRLAARHADIIAFTGAEPVPGSTDGSIRLSTAATVDERVAAARRFTAEFDRDPEFNILIQQVVTTSDRAAAAAEIASHADHLTPEEVLDLPTFLIGTTTEMADQLRRRRERFGFSYVTVLEPAVEDFAPVIAELRG